MKVSHRQELLESTPFVPEDIPYSTHATPELVSTRDGDYVAVIRLDGIAFQTVDIGDVNIAHETLNIILRNIASPHLTVWHHLVHEPDNAYAGGRFRTRFAQELDEVYRKDIGGTRLMSSSIYLTLVYRPILEKSDRALLKRAAALKELREVQEQAREKLQEMVRLICRMMARYSPTQLTTYFHNGIMFSRALEFFSYLLNGFWQRVPVIASPIYSYLATARPCFGIDAYELRAPHESRYGLMLAFQSYPPGSYPGILNELLSQPFSFVLTQSFAFMDKPSAMSQLKRERAKLDGSGELVDKQIEDIDEKIEALGDGALVYGGHHLSLNVMGRSTKELKDALNLGMGALGNIGCTVAREDDALIESFQAQLPGNYRKRPRVSGLDSRNFAAMIACHNYPMGEKSGNQWGDAIMTMRTTAGTPYFYNFHHSKASVQKLIRNSAELNFNVDVSSDDGMYGESSSKARQLYQQAAVTEVDTLKNAEEEVEYLEGDEAPKAVPTGPRPQVKKMVANLGNTGIIGPAGSGKTVMQGLLATFSLKVENIGMAVLDKDEGMKLMVLANGGSYLSLKSGVSSGMAPLQVPAVEANIQMAIRLVKKLSCPNGEPLSEVENSGISRAVREIMKLPQHERLLRQVWDLLPYTGATEGAKNRLGRWVYDGENAWVFDNEQDLISLESKIVGFDITEFLDNPEIRSPIIMYLAHRIRHEKIVGKPFVWFWDEFWKSLQDPELLYIAKDELKTIRKKDGLLVMGTQEAEDIVNSPISSSIIQQTATMIFCPNPKADRAAYITGLKLTETEFEIVRTGMPAGSNRYLIKQGHSSVVVEVDLSNPAFADALSILSGTKANVLLLESIMAEVGTDPNVWLPIFYERRRGS
ncbi:hypothetical protein AWV79_35830 [Cupriavidus sp. UYMMa02A]|nr:hypothetical protein AWV79_35830 [Cupriavidus sp. UYMMa02A]